MFLFTAPIDFFNRLIFEIDPLERSENVMDKTNPPLLAIGQQIETNLFLSLDDQASRIFLRLFERRAFPTKLDLAALRCRQPSRTGKTADGARRHGWKLHGFASEQICSQSILSSGAKDNLFIKNVL
jgi:hypothetical protein